MSQFYSIFSNDEENRTSDASKIVGRILGEVVFIGFLYTACIGLLGASVAGFTDCTVLNGKRGSNAMNITTLVPRRIIGQLFHNREMEKCYEDREGFMILCAITIIISLCMSLYGWQCAKGTDRRHQSVLEGLCNRFCWSAGASVLFLFLLIEYKDFSFLFFHCLCGQMAFCLAVAYFRLINLMQFDREFEECTLY